MWRSNTHHQTIASDIYSGVLIQLLKLYCRRTLATHCVHRDKDRKQKFFSVRFLVNFYS